MEKPFSQRHFTSRQWITEILWDRGIIIAVGQNEVLKTALPLEGDAFSKPRVKFGVGRLVRIGIVRYVIGTADEQPTQQQADDPASYHLLQRAIHRLSPRISRPATSQNSQQDPGPALSTNMGR